MTNAPYDDNPADVPEPPPDVEDTRPTRPVLAQETPAAPQSPDAPQWSVPEAKSSRLVSLDEPGNRSCLLPLVVLFATTCLCVTVVGLSALAGYRDELRDIQTDEANDRLAAVGTQYALAVQDQANGAAELAADRYEWIATQQPGYADTALRLTQIAAMLAATPTPAPSPTVAATATPSPTPTAETPAATPSPETPAVEDYFQRAEVRMNVGLYEEAIEWLDVVIQTDPTFRRFEVDQMLVTALTTQGRIYLRGMNLDDGSTGRPGNQLARGVQLVKRAEQIWTAQPGIPADDRLRYEADFAERFLAAQAYLAGGAVEAARQVLEQLCRESCGWGYRGVTVESLLLQAGGSTGS